MRDLAPDIYRQRLVIEGTPSKPISDDAIRQYLAELSEAIGMNALCVPVTHLSALYGWAGWIHWETSGAHFYAWERPRLFFSADIYACKRFEVAEALRVTRDHFCPIELEFREY